MQFGGGGEGIAERAVEPDGLARLQLAEAVGARADALDQEIEAQAGCGGTSFGHRKGAGQEGALAGVVPMLLGGKHVELARLGIRPPGVEQREEAVATGRAVLDDLAETAPERGGHCACLALFRPWTSCRERTSESPSIVAAIARTAAVAPVIVVTQGMPWRTAAVRIS